MALRIKTWLLVGTALLWSSACAKGVNGKTDRVRDQVDPDDASQEEEPDEEDAGDLEEEDAGAAVDEPDAALDAGTPKDSGSDAGPKDASMDAAPEAAMPEAATPDAGTVVDAGPDASRPPPKALPAGPKVGEWTYVEVAGAQCRDGSPAGYYHRKGDDNLMILLGGTGACTDSFYCPISPKNMKESFNPDSLVDAVFGITTVDPLKDGPSTEGIFKRDARNPVGSWSMVFVPYCTGDVHAGSKPNATVDGVSGQQQFVGYTNVGLFLKSFGPSFPDAQRVLLAGTGAGGFGALLNTERTQDFFAPQGAKVFVVTDSGIPFQDQYLSACLQKRWRDLWNFEAILPQACTGCRNADGGGLAQGLGTYLFKQRFKDRMMGGLVTSSQDEIIRLFFSDGLNSCTGGDYTTATFQAGLKDVINNVVGADRIGYYVINSTTHMHLWRPRFYEDNGVGGSIASWLADILAEKATHRGTL